MKSIRKNEGFTLIELLIVVAIIGIIAAIAIPGLLRARMSGNEASAIGSVRAIHSAQATFAASCGGGGYSNDMAQLGTAPTGGVAFISPDLLTADAGLVGGPGSGTGKSGYSVEVGGDGAQEVLATACVGAQSWTTFAVAATPLQYGSTGQRHFYSNQTGTIWQDTQETTGFAVTSVANPTVGGTVAVLQ